MFVGSHSISMDNKGRVIVPQEFRSEFGETVVVSIGPDLCLLLYTKEVWDEFAARLMAIPDMNNPKMREIKRFMFSNTTYCDFDKMGRILISKKHREYAKLDSSVRFVGMGSRLELWSDEEFAEPGEGQNVSDLLAQLPELVL